MSLTAKNRKEERTNEEDFALRICLVLKNKNVCLVAGAGDRHTIKLRESA